MKHKIKVAIKKRIQIISHALITLACITAVVYFMPRDKIFNYRYSINTPWSYGQIIAKFNFPVYKSNEQLKAEKDSIISAFEPYFTKDAEVAESALQEFRRKYNNEYYNYISEEQYVAYKNKLHQIYDKGIISTEALEIVNRGKSRYVKLVTDNISTSANCDHFLKKPEAYKRLVFGDTLPREVINRLRLEEYISANIVYDSVKSNKVLNEELNSISLSNGVVQEGQKIISKGDIIDSETMQVLNSYQYELEKRRDDSNKSTTILLGQIGFVLFCFLSLLSYIYIYSSETKENYNKFLLVMLLATVFPVIVGIMMQARIGNVFMLPLTMVPIILTLFTDTRTAFITHTISIIICSIMLTASYEFLFLQIMAGCVAIYCIKDLSSRSQIFRCVFFILLTYTVLYLCYQLIVESDITKIEPRMYIYFVINAILLLFAYPLMFIIEKLFGFISNVTLIELSNVSSKLLRKLSQDAPGTFQHSVQVGNLAAEAASAIGANSLEVRTGALFHDIGKTLAPIYFTENQSGGINPHNQLTPQESARLIIKHVTDGAALAEKHSLPKAIKDFILTHHGKGKVGYFYITYKNSHPDEAIDEAAFTYPGPNPFTREQAILMLADCVEAASHSISEYTAENIDNLVNKIIDSKIAEGTLRTSPITFKEIDTIKEVFKERLKAIYHTRISYPAEKK